MCICEYLVVGYGGFFKIFFFVFVRVFVCFICFCFVIDDLGRVRFIRFLEEGLIGLEGFFGLEGLGLWEIRLWNLFVDYCGFLGG